MKKQLAIALLAACALTLSACGGSGAGSTSSQTSASPATDITIGLTYIPDIQFAPFYVAAEKGYFADEGLNVTLRHHGSQESLFGALTAGEEDVVFAGGDEIMQERSNGTDVVDWATMYQSYPVSMFSLSSGTSDGIHAADIKGKTIGLPGPYGENYFALLAMLKDQGLSEDDVTIQYIGYTQTAALLSGEVDAVIGYANSDAVAIENALTEAGRSETLVSDEMVQGGLPLVGVGLGSLGETLEENRNTYTKILAALDKAVTYAEENPDETLTIAATYVPSLSDADARTSATQILTATLALYQGAEVFGSQNTQTWEKMAEFMDSADLLSSPVTASDAFIDVTK